MVINSNGIPNKAKQMHATRPSRVAGTKLPYPKKKA